MGGFLRILSYLKRYKTLTFLNVLFNVLTVIFGLFSIAMLIPFLSLLFETGTTELVTAPAIPEFSFSIGYLVGLAKHHFVSYIVQHGKFDTLGLVCVVIVLVFLSNLSGVFNLWAITPKEKT